MHIDFFKIQKEYKNLEYSPFKLSCIKNAIQSAEEEKEYYWQLKFMRDYIYEVTFEGDLLLEMLMFPQYLSLYDTHPEIHGKYPIKELLWTYKWILVDLSGFYQISYEKAIEYLEDFKKRCTENGYSLREYYKCLSSFLEHVDEEKYTEIRKKYFAEKRDSLSTYCEACELNSKVYFELYHGSFEKALELAQPILEGEKRCPSIPRVTYNNFLDYYMNYEKDMKKAAIYEKLLIKELKEMKNLTNVSTLLQYYALTDVNKGIRIWKKCVYLDIKNHYPLEQFFFEKDACFLLKKVREQRKKKTLKIQLPKEFLLYREDDIYNLDELIGYYQNNVTEIAEKFDKRNRNDNFKKRLNYLNF